jgi:hypothetical protein
MDTGMVFTPTKPFNKSEMRYLETKVRELDMLSYEIILRNTGSRRPEYVRLGSDLNAAGAALLASASPDMVYITSAIIHSNICSYVI